MPAPKQQTYFNSLRHPKQLPKQRNLLLLELPRERPHSTISLNTVPEAAAITDKQEHKQAHEVNSASDSTEELPRTTSSQL